MQPAITATRIGLVETLPTKTINGIAGFIGNPFFIDIFVQPRQHPHDLRAARINPDIAAKRIHHINGFDLV